MRASPKQEALSMPKFEINQRVKISNPRSPQHGRFGIVVEINDGFYAVELDGQMVEADEQSLQDATFEWEIL
jgi:hypothetical protein